VVALFCRVSTGAYPYISTKILEEPKIFIIKSSVFIIYGMIIASKIFSDSEIQR